MVAWHCGGAALHRSNADTLRSEYPRGYILTDTMGIPEDTQVEPPRDNPMDIQGDPLGGTPVDTPRDTLQGIPLYPGGPSGDT